MTFDFARASSIPYMVPYKPDPVPGYTWDPRGFWLNMAGTDQIDTTHSLNYVWMEGGRSTCSPTRSQGSTLLFEHFTTPPSNNYALVQAGTGVARQSIAADGYPALAGQCLTLGTGGSAGSVAGIQRTLGTIPASFSYEIIVNTQAAGTNPLDAFQAWVQNSAGVTLMTRWYNGICEVFDGYGWHWIGNIGGPGLFSEGWVECHDNGDGTHTVGLYGGCQLYSDPVYSGPLPTGQLFNNGIYLSQQSGATAARCSMVLQFCVGPTQLPDNMVYCTPAVATGASPTNGHVQLLFEDVSRDIVLGTNLHVFLTKENTGTWIEVPLVDAGVIGKGEIDVTADVRRVVGDVIFPPGSGAAIRAYVASNSGAFLVLQGLTVFWDA